MTARTSRNPAVTADNANQSAFARTDNTRARVVLPQPGGPQSTMDGNGVSPVNTPANGIPAPSKCGLSDNIRRRFRTHPVGKRGIVHSSRIMSVPAGGVKEKIESSATVRSIDSTRNRAVPPNESFNSINTNSPSAEKPRRMARTG